MTECKYCRPPYNITPSGGKITNHDNVYYSVSFYRRGVQQSWSQIKRCPECFRKLGD